MSRLRWNEEKNAKLKAERGIGFEQIVRHIESGDVVKVFKHPNPRYPRQWVMVVDVEGYAYYVPYVPETEYDFLKTIIPSRKATRDYLGAQHEDDQA